MSKQLTRVVTPILGLALLLALSCGTTATPTPVPVEPVTTAASESESASTPTPTAQATSPPAAAESARDVLRMVIAEDPASLSPWIASSSEETNIFRFSMGEPTAWLDIPTLTFGPTSGFTGWEQTASDTWHFFIRSGVKFHNGEPFTAEGAAWNFSHHGDPANGHTTIGQHGPMTSRAVDEETVEIVCEAACPLLPRNLRNVAFQAPEWYRTSPPEVRDTMTIGFGPYKFGEFKPGVSLSMTEYEEYVPVPESEVTSRDLHKPYIPKVEYQWRVETTVRSAMVAAGEADYAYLLDLADIERLPVSKTVPQMEAESFLIDTLWHPLLSQKKFRQALVYAIDCQEIVQVLYQGLTQCTAVPATAGMEGITKEHTTWWEYDPELSRQLLEEVEYQGEPIRITGREGRFPKQVEAYEAIMGYWSDVGINGELEVVERSVWTETRNCGLGNITGDLGPNEPITADIIAEPPTNCPDPGHLVETATEWTTLDFQYPAARGTDCYALLGRVCKPEYQELLEAAKSAPEGPERTNLLTQIADRMKEDVLFITFYQSFEIHGMQENVQYEPRPDNRIRPANIRFTEQ
jgi:peptide/nickel transport system substrate-binding protein